MPIKDIPLHLEHEPAIRPSWIELSARSLAHNFHEIQRVVGRKAMIPMVKANAYGHGAVEISRELEYLGAAALGVVSVGEGLFYPFTPNPVMSIKAELLSTKTIPAGDSAGYARTWRAEKDTRLGLITFGYADGYNRKLSNNWYVLVGGKRAPIRGRVSMDQTIIELPDDPNINIGDEVVILGQQGDERITLEMIATQLGTIVNEVAAGLNAKRLPRIVIK